MAADDLAGLVDSSTVAEFVGSVGSAVSLPLVVLVVAGGAFAHALRRSGLPRSLFRTVIAPGSDLVAVAESALGCGALVALVDLSCPHGLAAVGALSADPIAMPVLVVGNDGSEAEMVSAVVAGAGGFLDPRLATGVAVAGCLRDLVEGRAALSLGAVRALSRRCERAAAHRPLLVADRLTWRQRQVVLLAAEGRGNREIAAELRIEVSTVKKHLHAAFVTLEISGRSDLLELASRRLSVGAGF